MARDFVSKSFGEGSSQLLSLSLSSNIGCNDDADGCIDHGPGGNESGAADEDGDGRDARAIRMRQIFPCPGSPMAELLRDQRSGVGQVLLCLCGRRRGAPAVPPLWLRYSSSSPGRWRPDPACWSAMWRDVLMPPAGPPCRGVRPRRRRPLALACFWVLSLPCLTHRSSCANSRAVSVLWLPCVAIGAWEKLMASWKQSTTQT